MAASSLLAVALAALALAFVLAAGVVGRRELRALTAVAPRPGVDLGPLLVVMPARNEALRLGPVLAAVRAQRGALDVLVVDDRSTDDTARIVREHAREDPRVRLLQLHNDPPPGVFGKPRALQAALDDALGRGALPDHVLFLDADVELQAGALAGALEALGSSGAVALSGVPRVVCATAVEALFVPALISVATGRHPPSRVHRVDDDTAFLNGQFILARTAPLLDAGAWRAVQGSVLEDVALARLLKSQGHQLRLADLRSVARTRMYRSWSEIVDGFGKNAVALLGPSAGAIGAFAGIVSLLPHAALAAALVSGEGDAVRAVAVMGAVTLALQAGLRKHAGAPVWPVVILPVVYGGVAWVLCRATLRHMLGAPVRWSGRTYAQRAPNTDRSNQRSSRSAI